MPDKGFVATFTDITSQVAADKAPGSKPTRRWSSGSASARPSWTRVNHALGKAAADEANIGKTRFSPRPATTSCSRSMPCGSIPRRWSSWLGDLDNSSMVRNIDPGLVKAEIILGAVLDISRPRHRDEAAARAGAAAGLLERIETDFAPIAREKDLAGGHADLLTVRSDPNLLRRLVREPVSNAIKYTPSGRVLVEASAARSRSSSR